MSKELDKLINLINKKYGEGTLSKGAGKLLNVERLSTGIVSIDLAIGGGLPKSSVIELFGREGSAKTTVALKTIATFQKAGLKCAYIDMEHALNPDWAKTLGVDLDNLLISQPDTAELSIDILDTLTRSKELDLIVYDSLAAAIPQEEVDKSAFDQQMALLARLFSKACRKLTSALQPENINDPNTYNNTIIMMINQIRENVGIMYGNPETTSGGHALRHTYKIRIEFRPGDYIKENKEIIGREIKFKIVKNKVWKPYVTGMFQLFFDGSINNDATIITEAIKLGIVKQSGPMYSYKEIREKGKENFIELLKSKNLINNLTKELFNEFTK